MAESKVGSWLEENQGETISTDTSESVLRAVLEDLLETPGISEVVMAWFRDYWALKAAAVAPQAHGEAPGELPGVKPTAGPPHAPQHAPPAKPAMKPGR